MKHIIQNWRSRYFSNPQFFILGFMLTLGLVIILFLGDMLMPVFAAVVIAYLLDGMVDLLRRARIPRALAAFVVFILFMASLLVFIIFFFPLLYRQIGQLLQELPSMIAAGQKLLLRLPEKYPGLISEQQIRQFMAFLTTELTHLGQQVFSISLASVRIGIALLVYLILVPLLIFFFLKDKEAILKWFKDLLPEDRGLATEVWYEVNQQISNYVRGKIWEILIIWGASYITFWFLDLQFTLLLSLFVGLSVLVPYVGVTVMVLPVALVAYFQWGVSANLWYALLAYTVIQLLDGNLLAPLLLAEVVNLHPLAIIVAILMFGGLWGIWGLVFAIPLATLAHAVIKAWLRQYTPDMGSAVTPGPTPPAPGA